jgi:hypothetical protein
VSERIAQTPTPTTTLPFIPPPPPPPPTSPPFIRTPGEGAFLSAKGPQNNSPRSKSQKKPRSSQKAQKNLGFETPLPPKKKAPKTFLVLGATGSVVLRKFFSCAPPGIHFTALTLRYRPVFILQRPTGRAASGQGGRQARVGRKGGEGGRKG